ncbi:MAG TPA: hypothetical protein IAD03_10265 [Candidatus Caccousia stercoris]|uniref:Uncharacterized protein n=1 Tax=Candidatus Caccousia stercoris TaxID=2840723 RepID=A0A9D1FTZ9_9FIRM|nr:hypothetical protein [Candidatus Caccousia stercoris]
MKGIIKKVLALFLPPVFPGSAQINPACKIHPVQLWIFFRKHPSDVIQDSLLLRRFSKCFAADRLFHHMQIVCKKAVGQIAFTEKICVLRLDLFRSIPAINHRTVPVDLLFGRKNTV